MSERTGGYIEEITTYMPTAWERVQGQVKKAQKKQKQHDKYACPATFISGDRAFVNMPAKTTVKTRKFTRPLHRPYRVLEVFEQGVSVYPVDDPRASYPTVGYKSEQSLDGELAQPLYQSKNRMVSGNKG